MNIYPYFLALFFIYAPYTSTAQNLIRNGSFEEHGEQKCLECNTLYGQFPALVYTVIYDAWYPVKWRVRPLCTSNYLTIGLFADDQWPASRSFDDLVYFVDKVSLTEIPGESAIADSSIYYCSRYDPKALGASPKLDNQILLFENDAFNLTAEHEAALDSFVVYAKKYPDLVFELSGHTDSIGTKNLALSQNRAQSVFKYLTEEHKLPSFRFVTLGMGGKNPFRPNHSEEGRKLNRRVEIRQSGLNLANMFYRQALKAVEEKHYPDAFSWLNKGYQGGLNALPGYIPEIDTVLFEMTPLSEANIQRKCEEHFAALQPILAKTGWPKKSEFGEGACNAAFSILLNSGAIVDYLKWLPIVEKSCEEGETPWINYAVLFDRCRISLGKPQRYLTDLRPSENGELKPWEGDEDSINEYRAKIGLPLLSLGVVEAMKSQKKKP